MFFQRTHKIVRSSKNPKSASGQLSSPYTQVTSGTHRPNEYKTTDKEEKTKARRRRRKKNYISAYFCWLSSKGKPRRQNDTDARPAEHIFFSSLLLSFFERWEKEVWTKTIVAAAAFGAHIVRRHRKKPIVIFFDRLGIYLSLCTASYHLSFYDICFE